MDELKIKSKLMRDLISKLLSSEIQKKFGYSVHIDIFDLDITIDENATLAHVNANVEINNDIYKKFTRFIKS